MKTISGPPAIHDENEPALDRKSGNGAAVPDGDARDRLRCLFVNTYYPAFLDDHYRRNPALRQSAYAVQKQSLLDTFFGDSDFYSRGLRQAGFWADDIIINCDPLQLAWAAENQCEGRGLAVGLAQIRRIKPHVVYIQDLNLATQHFLQAIRPYTHLIAGQIASPIPSQAALKGFDVLFSSFPHYVDDFRQDGMTAYYMPLAFDERVLQGIGTRERIHPVTFVGGISPSHRKALDVLEMLGRETPLLVWGYGAEQFSPESSLRQRHRGPAWGLQMFSLLAQSQIALNRHIDVARSNANNMRLFEATGCGALLMTDYKDNLASLFDIGREIVAYRSPEECAALIKYYLAHPGEARAIAEAGQTRTLREHSYTRRMVQTAEVLERQIRYRDQRSQFKVPDMRRISYDYRTIQPEQVDSELCNGWKSEDIPGQQRGLVQRELLQMYRGQTPEVFQVLTDAIALCRIDDPAVLEIGCASGYYYEALSYLLKRPLRYWGVDYSPALIAMAHDFYPEMPFYVADGGRLPFKDARFDIVVSSGVLQCVPEYPLHIREAARTARDVLIVHRASICRRSATQLQTKRAYGVLTVEMRFNEAEFLEHFHKNGFSVYHCNAYYEDPAQDQFDITYVFKRSSLRTISGR